MRFLIILFSFLVYNGYSQNTLTIEVNGLEDGDSAKIKLSSGTSDLLVKKALNPTNKKAQVVFSDLSSADDWVVAIDAPGYAYPTSKVISIPTVSSLSIDITKYSSNSFIYEWQDDSSYVGHATQTYINEPFSLVVLDDTIDISINFPSIKLREEYGIVLSNEEKEWSDEDAFRLYSNLERFEDIISPKEGEGQVTDFSTGEYLNSVWILTDDVIENDISVNTIDNVITVKLSSASLTYAEPLTVKLDGIRGKFYSKRLYQAVLRYFSDFGNNKEVLDKIAQNRFGFRWMVSDSETSTLMDEPADHFQEFFPEEKLEILSMLEELPEGMHRLECNNYLVRRVNGQDNPVYPQAPAIAWTSGVMEWMEKAFKNSSYSYMRRLILHEKAHYLWQCYVDQQTKDEWAELGGWYEDPLSSTGWSTWKTAEFVSAYGHEKNPNEDFAESISWYVENVDGLKSRSMQKYEFIRDRVMSGTRYISKIRDDLTFTVYNLFPDYFYPGKVIGTKVEVLGEPEEDKKIKFTIKVKSDSVELDGASLALIRFHSSIGTLFDMYLNPVNGSIDSVLTGEYTMNKHAKSGYWRPIQIVVWDNVGNQRLENNNTVGAKVFVNNPLEDIDPPKYISYSLDTITDLFHQTGQDLYKDNSGGNEGPVEYRALRVTTNWFDKSPLKRSLARIQFRNTSVYSLDTQVSSPCGPTHNCTDSLLNGYNSIKTFKMYAAIPEYYPSDYYSITFLNTTDIAKNVSSTWLSVDTASFNDNPTKGIFKDLRDSIYIETSYPDTLAPIAKIGVGEILIDAEPVNPVSPDGETKIEIKVIAKDTSNYFGKEASLTKIEYILRDPKGIDHRFQYFPDGGNGFGTLTPDSAAYEWNSYKMNARLPKGSTPGLWGMTELLLWDKAGNQRRYSFVEYVRFDLIKSDIVLTSPLYAEITDKLVNASNVDSISAFITCTPCSDLKYNYTIYSLMGGVVKTGEKLMGSDSVYVTDLDVSGIPDGIIKLTVQLKDSLDQLVATTTTDYTKDVILPNSYYFQSNLQNIGRSNIDSLKITVNTVEVNGTYEVTVTGDSTVSGNTIIQETDGTSLSFSNSNIITVKHSKKYTGTISESEFNLSGIDVSNFADGPITFNLIVTDSALNKGIEVFKKVINKEINSEPVTSDKSVSTNEDTNVNIILTGTDADGDNLTYAVGTATNGTVTLSGDTAVYTPNLNFNGSDTFEYTVSDENSSSTSTVTVTVTSVNDLPLVNNLTITVIEDFSDNEISLSGTDIEDNTLTFLIIDHPSFGKLDTTTLIDSRVRAYESRNAGSHLNNSHYSGSPKTTIEGQANAVVNHLVNGHPKADWREIYSITADDPWVSTYSRGTDGELRPSLLSTVGKSLGSGFKGGHLFVPEVMFETFKGAFNETNQAILDDTSNYVMFGESGFKVLYTPDENFFGTDSFTYIAKDSNGGVSDKATVSITITPVNDAPTSLSSYDSLDEDYVTTFNLTGDDVDGDALSYIITDSVKNGIIEFIDDNGRVLYTPDADFNGIDSLKFKVNDGLVDSDTSVYKLIIRSVYDLPEISLSTEKTSSEEVEITLPISIKLEGVDAGDESVTFDLVLSGTSSDSDYTISSKSYYMDTGLVDTTANLVIIDDTEYEEDETITISVENIQNALDAVESVTITILRNDVPLGETFPRIVSKVYPNPAKEYFVIEFNDIYKLEEIEMIDPLGRVFTPNIREKGLRKLVIDISKSTLGSHILRLKTDVGSAIFRVVVE